MKTQSLVQVRMDRSLRDDVAKIFESLGFDLSTAVRMFFLRCRAEQGIPFPLTVVDTTAKTPRIGIAKGKWHFSEDWEKKDKEMDKQLEADFYADLA